MDQLVYALFGLGLVVLLCAVAVKGPGRWAPGTQGRPGRRARPRPVPEPDHQDLAA